MIGMPGGDGLGPIELFGQHGAGEHVGPGEAAEGEFGVGAGEHGGVQAFGAADHEGDRAAAGLPMAEAGGEGWAVEGVAVEVQHHQQGFGGQGRQEGSCLPAFDFGGAAGAIRQFDHSQAGTQAFGVAGDQVGFRGFAGPADGDQQQVRQRWRTR